MVAGTERADRPDGWNVRWQGGKGWWGFGAPRAAGHRRRSTCGWNAGGGAIQHTVRPSSLTWAAKPVMIFSSCCPGIAMNCLLALRELGSDQTAVLHNPMSARYQRAQARLEYLRRHASYLGQREHDDLAPDEALEFAVWAPPPSGTGKGYYACFRLEFEDGYPVFATLFAFYDGTDGSPGFTNLHAARAFAQSEGFMYEDQD